MKEIAYVIDKDQSLKNSNLVIRIIDAEREGYYLKIHDKTRPLFVKEIEKLLTPLDKLALSFLIQEEIKFQKKTSNKIVREETLPLNSLNILSTQANAALKLMAATGKLYFKDKPLAADFYGKTDFSYSVESLENGEISVSGILKWNGNECNLSECDFICPGNPHFFIKGIVLKMIGTDVTWKELSRLMQGFKYLAKDIKELQEAHAENPDEPVVNFRAHAKVRLEQTADPLPYLVLKDKTGAFADLWMDFGNGKKYSFHDVTHKKSDAEKGFEKDLLETDFLIKQMANSHYYCPLDKVAKSLTFLLEIGWKIFDFQGRELKRHTDFDVRINQAGVNIEAKGTLNYESHKVNLSDVVGAFNRRERFVQLSDNTIGLIPDSFENKALDSLMEISEVVNDSVSFKRHHIGVLKDLDDQAIYLDEDLAEIRQKLEGFQGISLALPHDNFKGILRDRKSVV